MEYSIDEYPTPRFGYDKDKKTLFEDPLEKKIPKYTKDTSQCVKNDEKYKNRKTAKSKSKERNKSKSKNKKKNKGKEKSKNKYNTKSKQKNNSSIILPIGLKPSNFFDIFTEKFLLEKELAFEKFLISEDANYLDN